MALLSQGLKQKNGRGDGPLRLPASAAVRSSSPTPPGQLLRTRQSPPNPFGVRASLGSDGEGQPLACCDRSGRAASTAPAGRRFKAATPYRRVGCVHPVHPVRPSPRVSSRGGLVVAPPGRHPKGEVNAAKTFCEGPQKQLSAPFSCRPAVAPLPFAARELTREMDNHHHRRKPGCTHETSTSEPPLKNLPGR